MDITLDLAPGTVLHLPTGHRVQLHLSTGTQGRLWLTRRGDADDHFILPGAVLDVEGAEQVVVESDGPGTATVRIVALGRLGLWQRWRQGWQQRHGPRWPAELQGLDAHLLRDIGAQPALWMQAQALSEAHRVTGTRAHQLGLA